MPAKPIRIAIVAVVLAAVAAGAWLLAARPRPTALGWPAAMTTVAGNGERGFTDGAAGMARFSDPFAVAIDAKGALYVADAGATNRIRKIDPDGRTSTLPGTFDTPSGVAVDAKGNVYVADTGGNRIAKVSRDGAVTTLAGDGAAGFRDGAAGQAQFNGPIGVAVGKGGEVYVADTYNDRIRLISPQGQVTTLAGGESPVFSDGAGAAAAFDRPCGLALNRDGALLIADAGNDAIRKLGKDGRVTTLARAGSDPVSAMMKGPVGVAVTADNYVYIASFRRGRILQLSPTGELRILVGRDASNPANRQLRLTRPAGLAIDRRGALYVAETATFAIRKLAPRRKGETAPATTPDLAHPPPALLQAASVPWPLAPQDAWHEVVGDVGEVRGNNDGDSRDHLHAGLDVRADVGQTVLAIAQETVESPVESGTLDVLGEGLQIDQVTYIHMRVGRTSAGLALDPGHFQLLRNPGGKVTEVRVKRGTRFQVGDPLGTVNGMAHVHLELGSRGGDANPIGLRFPGLEDHIAPRILAVQLLDGTGRRLTERANGRLIVARSGGPLSIVAEAVDQVDGDAPGRRLGLYRAGYQILHADGSPVKGFEQPLVTILFDRLPLDPAATKIAYAPDSGETVHGANETRFFYVVSNRVRGGVAKVGGWSPASLPPGDYTVRILAADYAGNAAVEGRDLPITLR
jgi:DNA-binding beta-propeller fold protein YncE